MVKAPETLEKMGKAAIKKAVRDVPEHIYEEIKKVVKGDKTC